jgi:glyoxylase-like metal-dependent hydrolase (beta-lactamase superfamily II)
MDVVFEQIKVGNFKNFGYILGDKDTKQAVLIDPSWDPSLFVKTACSQGMDVICVINTHGHEDHTNGNDTAVSATDSKLLEYPFDGQKLVLGGLKIKFYRVPGHCADHILIHEEVYNRLFTGDLLFVGAVGGIKATGDLKAEWESLRRLRDLPQDATVWPGHDYGSRPSSTLKLEFASNPFLMCKNFKEFAGLMS